MLGDICGSSGMEAIRINLKKIIKEKNIDFTVANGENAADTGKGITKKNISDLFIAGVNVITSGNHIWDEKEILEIIEKDKRLIRPENLFDGQPGHGFGIYEVKKKKIAVINLMGNVFMKKSEDVFIAAKLIKKIRLKEEADFILVDMHGE